MKFLAIIALLEAGTVKRITSPSVFTEGEYIALNEDGGPSEYDEDGYELGELVLTKQILEANDFREMVTVPDVPQMFGYFNAEKNRWMSTNNPEKLRAQGVDVKTFVVQV